MFPSKNAKTKGRDPSAIRFPRGFNSNVVKLYHGGNLQNYRNTLVLFNQTIEGEIGRIEKGIHSQNWKDACSVAHQLKSGFKTMGLDGLAQTAKILEKSLCSNRPLQDSPPVFRQLKRQLGQAIPVARQFQRELERCTNG